MTVINTTLYEQQLKDILAPMADDDIEVARNFKLYLDTIVLNAPTKEAKYKRSIYFDDDDIKDIEHDGYTIPFFVDRDRGTLLVLGIVDDRLDKGGR